MSVDDLPFTSQSLIHLGANPAHGAFAAVADVVERYDRSVADDLDSWIDDLVTLDFDFPAELVV